MSDLTRDLAAVLFVASEPLSIEQLSLALDIGPQELERGLDTLSRELTGGVVVTKHDGRYQLVTSPEASRAVSSFLQQEAKTDLTRAALETLAIIAYRGPITKTDIETIRGVASDTMLKNLMQRGLIVESGKTRDAGRSVLYAVSHAFLQQFGLTSIEELPDLEKADQA